MNIYKPFKKGKKFGIKNTTSKYPKQNRLKIFFQTEEVAQEYCDFLMEKEKTNRTVGRLKCGGNNAEGPVHLFLNLTLFKPKKL